MSQRDILRHCTSGVHADLLRAMSPSPYRGARSPALTVPEHTPSPPTSAPVTSGLRDQLQATLGSSYTLESELGGGGMSRVFAATETALGRKVVVKVLPAWGGRSIWRRCRIPRSRCTSATLRRRVSLGSSQQFGRSIPPSSRVPTSDWESCTRRKVKGRRRSHTTSPSSSFGKTLIPCSRRGWQPSDSASPIFELSTSADHITHVHRATRRR